jgi:hypothetical protein
MGIAERHDFVRFVVEYKWDHASVYKFFRTSELDIVAIPIGYFFASTVAAMVATVTDSNGSAMATAPLTCQ